jgi:hypothetical protein
MQSSLRAIGHHSVTTLGLFWFALHACQDRGRSSAPARSHLEISAGALTLELVEIDTLGLGGLSGLTFDGERLWAVPERTSKLVSFEPWALNETPPRAPLVHALDVSFGDDTESLTWLGGRRFAIGLEGQSEGRPSDRVILIVVNLDGTAGRCQSRGARLAEGAQRAVDRHRQSGADGHRTESNATNPTGKARRTE